MQQGVLIGENTVYYPITTVGESNMWRLGFDWPDSNISKTLYGLLFSQLGDKIVSLTFTTVIALEEDLFSGRIYIPQEGLAKMSVQGWDGSQYVERYSDYFNIPKSPAYE